MSTERKKRFYIETFGCQMNVNDSEKVAGLLLADGYEATEGASSADLVFVNTCAVREKAADKLFHALGRLRRLKRDRPELVVGVGGCVAQLHGTDVLERAPQVVDVLVGTHTLARVPELARRVREGEGPQVDLDRQADSFAVPTAAVAHSGSVRAYVTVMEGCNHVCSFCVVPRTRGPEVNRAPEAVVAEVEELIARGFREVMLLGQTVNAYRHGATDFAGLLALVHAVPGLERLRFTTSHPAHVDERLARAWSTLPRLCPYLHLPVQSGSDRILAAMRRGYSRREYLDRIALLRAHAPGLVITTDVIVGYPGESEADFESTLSLVDDVGFEGVFSFTYSPRPRTAAARLEDDVPEEEKRRRLQVLNQHQQRAQAARNAGHVGRREEVLVEAAEDGQRFSGRTPEFKIVHGNGPARVGEKVWVDITSTGPNALVGRQTIL
jgi:tRNA-2-methylthio-N6-dimethylallyladenosine synthase